MIKRSGKYNVIIDKFNSTNNLIEELQKREQSKFMKDRNASHTGDLSFTKTKDYNEALKLLIYGYQEPVDKIKSEFKINKYKDKINFENNVYGFVPNVANSILGLPNSMVNINKKPKKSKVVELIYSPDANASVSKDTFIENGIKMLNVISNLEANGISVKLTSALYCGTNNNNEIALATLNIKDYGQRLNLLKISFPIAHPSFLRRIGFKWLETSPDIRTNGFSFGYGKALSMNEYEYDLLCEFLGKEENLILLPNIINKSEEEIMEMVVI